MYSYIHYFSPHPLYYNHFTELLQILSGLDEKQQDAFFEEHYGKYHTGRKYDFFFFLTEQLLQKDLLHSLVLVIDDCDVLDQYSRDFLQYLVQYASDCGLQVLHFRAASFPFSIVRKLPSLGVEDMKKLLGRIPFCQIKYISEGEILHNISGGNLMILEKIFSGMRESLPKGEFDLSPYLEKTYDPHDIYIQTLEELSKKQIELLIAMYVLDGLDCDSICSALGKKSCKADLQELQEKGLLAVVEDRCVIQKKLAFQTWLHHNEEDDVQALMAKLLAYLKKQKLLTQVQLQLHILGRVIKKKSFDAMLQLC
jgi:hypothetical protein